MFGFYGLPFGSGYGTKRPEPEDELLTKKKAHWCSQDGHEAVQHGMLRSWCKHCDINMVFNRETAQFEVIP